MSGGLKLNLDRAGFLSRHWQKKPLHIPAALADFKPPVSRHELAGLALEEEVESRIVEFVGNNWNVHYGPFSEADFQRDEPWTLLVQAVDHYTDAVAQLRQLIDFIPQWRIDDIMVSYGSDGASVGPHYDNYDVFLLQGEGQKLWRIGQSCDDSSQLLQHSELRILTEFHTQEEFVLRTGDILYVPPGVAHWGIAQGESTTFSIGFRAPRINDMLSRWVDEQLEQMPQDIFYTDAGRSPIRNHGEITAQDVDRGTRQLRAILESTAASERWFGELVTEPRGDDCTAPDDVEMLLEQLCAGGRDLHLDAAAKLAWQRDEEGCTIFANGQSMPLAESALPCIQALCELWQLDRSELAILTATTEGRALLHFLLQSGCVHVE